MNDRASFIETALEYASRETRNHVADSLACYLHNDGYALEGNTEANDVEWFARNTFERHPDRRDGRGWERAADDEKERYRDIARGVMAVLPDFQLRIAHRLITLSKVVRDIERAERQQHAKRPSTSLARTEGGAVEPDGSGASR